MARYLTPHKIGLLILTSLVVQEDLPATANVSVLSFLVSHVLPRDGNQQEPADALNISIESFQHVLESLTALMPGRNLWTLWLDRVWQISTLDALHVFFHNLSLLLEDSNPDTTKRLTPSSVLGIVVRRAQLEFGRLQFQDTVRLWHAFANFRSPTWLRWSKRNPKLAKQHYINATGSPPSSNDNPWHVQIGDPSPARELGHSQDTVQKFLEYQIEKMQFSGARLSQDMTNRFSNIIADAVQKPTLSYYITFLDAWKGGDYNTSFEALHQYFDYTMHSRDNIFYQYALLNLAVLQADFGAHTEAISAMLETIATARENHDLACLNYSLCWLYHFGQANPRYLTQIYEKGALPPDREALGFLKSKAKEIGMWNVLCSALLAEAALLMKHGQSITLALQCTLKASHVHLVKNVRNGLGSHLMTESALYQRMGATGQAFLCNKLHQGCFSELNSAEDALHSQNRMDSMLAAQGHLRNIDTNDLPEIRTLRLQHKVIAHRTILRVWRCLHKNQLADAEDNLSQIMSLKSLSHDQSFELDLLSIEIDIHKGELSTALERIDQLAAQLQAWNCDLSQRIKAMIVKARILDLAEMSEKGFSVTMRAASLAYQANLLPLLWEAIERLCVILHRMSKFSASVDLLTPIIPRILECEDCRLAASCYLLLADAHTGQDISIKSQMQKASAYLEAAWEQANSLEHVDLQSEILSKKAAILRLNNDHGLADDCDARITLIRRDQ